MYIRTEGTAEIRHKDTGVVYVVDSDQLEWDSVGGSERGMGPETVWAAEIDHPQLGPLRWELYEYPQGWVSQTASDLNGHESIRDFSSGIEFEPDGPDEDLDDPDRGVFGEKPLDPIVARQQVLERLDRLEQMLVVATDHAGLMGHNGPPGPIDDPAIPEVPPRPSNPPFTGRDVAAIRGSLQDLRAEADSATPDVGLVGRSIQLLGRAWDQFRRWAQIAGDEAAKSIGKRAGDAIIIVVAAHSISWAEIGSAIHDLAAATSTWVQTLGQTGGRSGQ